MKYLTAIILLAMTASASADEPGGCIINHVDGGQTSFTSSRDGCARQGGAFYPLNPSMWSPIIIPAQNMSQMGNAGTANCTTQRCIDNVKRTVAGEKNLCTTDLDCRHE